MQNSNQLNAGNYIHGTDVSASFSNVTSDALDKLSDKSRTRKKLTTTDDKKLRRLAANLEGKTPDHLLIVGGGEINLQGSSSSESAEKADED